MTIAMSLGISFALAGCGETPVEMFNKANENMSAAKDVSIESTFNADVESSGVTFTVSGKLNAQYIKNSEKPLESQVAMFGNIEMMDQKSKVKMYMTDEKMYMNAGGSKTYTDISKSMSDEYMQSLLDLGTSEKIDDYVTDSSSDGDNITLTIDGSKYLESLIKKAEKNADDSVSDKDMKSVKSLLKDSGFSKMKIEATIKDDNFTSLKYSCDFTLDLGTLMGTTTSEKTPVKFEFDCKKIKINDGIKIDFPDFKDYKKATEDSIV